MENLDNTNIAICSLCALCGTHSETMLISDYLASALILKVGLHLLHLGGLLGDKKGLEVRTLWNIVMMTMVWIIWEGRP